MSLDEANEAITKAQHMVDMIDRATAEGLGAGPPT
jgi:hypothetical protein